MSVRILHGDCRDVLKTLPSASVHCVVTSPPYWGLRDYGTAKWEGGDLACDHRRFNGYVSGLVGTTDAQDAGKFFKDICGICGARRIDSQIGLETLLGEYIDTMVAVFREVRRVLRDDGTLWLNMGDSYSTSAAGNAEPTGFLNGKGRYQLGNYRKDLPKDFGLLKPKDLCGIPWRAAFALQADGWWLRQDIIWSKPNPMPESVTDRCTKAHEYIFLLSKSARYYYDAEAIAESAVPGNHITTQKSFGTQAAGALVKPSGNQIPGAVFSWGATRNKRSVWEVATAPFSEAHFATFPPALIEPCILAGCPEKCCAKCGAPWVREIVSELRSSTYGDSPRPDVAGSNDIKERQQQYGTRGFSERMRKTVETIGFSPSCSCDAGTVRGAVLDPFGGAGTTGLVADRLGRDAVLIELNPEYAAMAERRITDDAPLFAQVAAE